MAGEITTLAELEALYGAPGGASLDKVADHLSPMYAHWIAASKFCVMTTVGPDGTDVTPRGDDGPVVQSPDPHTLLMPDWRGNNRLDSLRNIVLDGRLSLMFMIAGNDNVVRVNGTATLSRDPDLVARFEDRGRSPRLVIVTRLREVYIHCARALMRAELWRDAGRAPLRVPSVGDLLAEQTGGATDGAAYDAAWAPRAARTLW